MVNELSVFEPLKFYCICKILQRCLVSVEKATKRVTVCYNEACQTVIRGIASFFKASTPMYSHYNSISFLKGVYPHQFAVCSRLIIALYGLFSEIAINIKQWCLSSFSSKSLLFFNHGCKNSLKYWDTKLTSFSQVWHMIMWGPIRAADKRGYWR